MSYTFFDPSQANELAKFQGSFAGAQAGIALHTGVAKAPTSIYNQMGYYALQDSDTGKVTVKKLADNSIYTKQWYDQGTGNTFNFSGTKTGFEASQLSGNMTASELAALDTNA